MAQIEKIQLGETSYSLGAASIPFAKVDSTSTSTVFTATVPEITELKDGVCVYLMNGVVTSASGCTLNINNLGAKPIYQSLAAASRSTTIFNIGYTMLFIYNSQRIANGCWDVFYGYNSNDNTIGYNIRDNQTDKKAALAIYRYMYCFTKRDGTIFPSTSASNKTTTNKTLNTDIAFDPTLPIYYYGYTTTINAGSSPGASYLWLKNTACSLQYGFNVATDSLDLKEPVYLQCSPQSNGTLKLANNNCVTQTLPSTADGYVYLYLGQTYSGHQIEFAPMHPCFIYDSTVGDIVVWHGATYARKSELVNYAPLSSPAFTGTPTIGGYNVLTTQDLTKVMHFRGVSSTAITDGGSETATIGGNQLTAEEGDIVIYNSVEYIWNSTVWEQMGDEYRLPIVIDINENDSIITVGDYKGYANNTGLTCTFLAQAFNKVPIYINFTSALGTREVIRLQNYESNVTLQSYVGDVYMGIYINYSENGRHDYIKQFYFVILSDNTILGTSLGDFSIGYATTAGGAYFADSANSADYATTAGSANSASTADYATTAGSADSANTANTANYATTAGSADSAGNAANADYATNAGSADLANSADITTTANAIAKYSDTSGTFADSGVTIDNNNNISTTGKITIGVTPTATMEIANKGYVDNAISAIPTPTLNATSTYFTGIVPITKGGTGNTVGYIQTGQKSGTTLGTKATAEGETNEASGNYSHAEGRFNVASGDYSHAEGCSTIASGYASHVEGNLQFEYSIGGTYAISGTAATTTYTYSCPATLKIFEGDYIALGPAGIKTRDEIAQITAVTSTTITVDKTLNPDAAISNSIFFTSRGNCSATAYNSHAEGLTSSATAQASHAEGSFNLASGTSSHAEGNLCIASGLVAHSEGKQTIASGDLSHSEGQYTVASGYASHAEGANGEASGAVSHVEGMNTIAQRKSQHVFGENNIADTGGSGVTSRGNYIEIVGNGSSKDSRSNARTLDWNGNETLAGKLTIGVTPTATMDVTTKGYVDALIPTSATVSSGVITFANSSGTTLFSITLPIYNGGVN